jgi:hypothetical protein
VYGVSGVVAFVARLGGGDVHSTSDSSIFVSTRDTTSLLAREGTQASECADGARWSKFLSLAAPGGPGESVIFTALLAKGPGGVNASNDMGAWARDSDGRLRLLFREGDALDGKKLKTFTFLNAAKGATGVTRSWNANGRITWRAEYDDGATAIVVTTIPTPPL